MFFWMVSITDLTQFEVVYCRWGHFPRLNKLMPMSVGKLSVRLSWTKKVLMTLQELCWLQIWTPQDTLTRQWKNLVWQLRHAPLIQINALIVATRDILVTTASNCMDILISGLYSKPRKKKDTAGTDGTRGKAVVAEAAPNLSSIPILETP